MWLVQGMSEMLYCVLGEVIKVEMYLVGDLWNVQVDCNQFENVLLNLVINVCDVMCGNGVLIIFVKNIIFDKMQG